MALAFPEDYYPYHPTHMLKIRKAQATGVLMTSDILYKQVIIIHLHQIAKH